MPQNLIGSFPNSEFLKTELEAREKCHQSYQRKSSTTKKYATAAALITGDIKTNCTFCRGKHSTSYCHVITDVNERKRILRKAGRCFLCLRKVGHLARDCDSSIRCFRCKGAHHIALCEKSIRFVGSQPDGEPKRGYSDKVKTKTDSSCQTSPQFNSSEQQPQNAYCGISTEKEIKGSDVLLQTAFVTAINPQSPNQKVNLRAIIDNAAQRSFISKRARDLLGLDAETQEEVLIKTFGNDEGQLKLCDCVSVELKSKQSEFSMQFNLLEVDQICSPLKGQSIRWAQKEYPHLQGLKLADFPSETETELEVDLMLGGDTLWPIMTSEIVHGQSKEQPVAAGTKFGWVLAGPVNNVPRSLLSCVNLMKAHFLRIDVECEPRVSSYSNESDQFMDQKVSELFELEALGITEIDLVHENFVKDIRFENGHYVVKLPWRQHHDILPDNFELSSGRLISTLKRLRRDLHC